MGFKESVLPNGLKVLIYTKEPMEGVGIALGFRYGSVDCGLGKKETAHFLEHMLFKGTRSRSWSDINNIAREYGIDFNAETGYETTVYEASAYRRYYPKALDVLLEMFKSAKLPAKDMHNELGTILHELAIRKDDPDSVLYDNMPYALYRSKSLVSSGTGESIKSISREDLRRAYELHYSPRNAAIAICGGAEANRAYKIVKSSMAAFSRAGGPMPVRKIFKAKPIKDMVIKRKDISREMVGIGFDVGGNVKGDIRRYAALMILAEALNNRIYDEVRERNGLSYDPRVEYKPYSGFGYIVASAGSEPGKSNIVKRLILEECRKVKEEGVTKKEIERVRHGLTVQFELLKENPEDLASSMLDLELKGINGKNALYMRNALGRVGVSNVNAYASKYIDVDRCSTIMLKKY